MRKFIFILSILGFNLTFSQTEKCSVQEIQLETYEYVLNHINEINKNFENKESLIEVTINIKERTTEQDYKRNFTKIKDIDYHLISPENSYNGKNKESIKVDSKLDFFILNKVKECSKYSREFKKQLYDNIIFRIPLTASNIDLAIKQVKSTID